VTPSPFADWLDEQLQPRKWSDYRLAKEAGVSHSVISKARAGIPPRWDACYKIATALNVLPESVFRAAGLLPPSPTGDLEELAFYYNQLPPVGRSVAINLIQALLKHYGPGKPDIAP